MAGTYRPTIIRYYDSQGRQVRKGTPGARRVREKSKTFWGRVPDANGKLRPVALCDDADAAEDMLAAMKQRAKRIARGDIDPFEEHRKRPLAEHLEQFQSALLAKGATLKQAQQVFSRCQKIIDACGFKRLADLWPSTVANDLRERRQQGLGIQTSNHYLAAIKSFANWLAKDRRIPTNPLTHLGKLNPKVDIRHERRALTQRELGGLIATVEKSQETFRGLNGSTRAMLYRLAAMTGLRASELASLTSASFELAAHVPTVTLEASYSKHRREDVLPLHPDLVARLHQWLTERKQHSDEQSVILSMDRAAGANPERLFPGTWTEKAAKMLRNDLDAADIPFSTDDGVADFHSLRHTFISNLAAGGVHPKLAQQLARHSTITLTMDRYSHVGLVDLNAALESLPVATAPEMQSMRATGTTDQEATDFSCTKSCTRPVQLNCFQPFSTVAAPALSENEKPRVSPSQTQENTGLIEAHPAGLEPATFGSVDRCSIQLS